MLADELILMLKRGYSLQYREVRQRQGDNVFLEPPLWWKAHGAEKTRNRSMDLWGGGRDAELGAWKEKA